MPATTSVDGAEAPACSSTDTAGCHDHSHDHDHHDHQGDVDESTPEPPIDVFRMKAVISVVGEDRRTIVQAVHELCVCSVAHRPRCLLSLTCYATCAALALCVVHMMPCTSAAWGCLLLNVPWGHEGVVLGAACC